jgi:hypothetical protein
MIGGLHTILAILFLLTFPTYLALAGNGEFIIVLFYAKVNPNTLSQLAYTAQDLDGAP